MRRVVGAALGVVTVLVVFVADVIDGGTAGTFVALPIYGPSAALCGCVVGVLVGALVSVALVLAGPDLRSDRLRSRLLAGAVAAVPGAVVIGFALPRLTGLGGWVILAGIAIGAVVAAAALAPRVALGRAGTAASVDLAGA